MGLGTYACKQMLGLAYAFEWIIIINSSFYYSSNPGPLTYESGALPIALRGPATELCFGDFSS